MILLYLVCRLSGSEYKVARWFYSDPENRDTLDPTLNRNVQMILTIIQLSGLDRLSG